MKNIDFMEKNISSSAILQDATKNLSDGAALLPRLAMLNSFAGFGGISTTVSLPIISAMQVQVCPIPTSILSNHLAFPVCSAYDYTPHLPDYIRAWKELKLSFDGFYCGFLSNAAQMDIVEDFMAAFKPSIFLLDPVMGDYGRTYSTITPLHCARMKELIARADIITPNLTEACLLTDTPYSEQDWTDAAISSLLEKLADLGSKSIVLTGVLRDNHFLNYSWEQGRLSVYATASTGGSRHGTGDLFASILIANALHHKALFASVKQAADFIGLCIREADRMGLPPKEGVPFEKFMGALITPEIEY